MLVRLARHLLSACASCLGAKECPNCGQDISDTYEPADPSVGIMGSGWYCVDCDLPVDDDGEIDYDE